MPCKLPGGFDRGIIGPCLGAEYSLKRFVTDRSGAEKRPGCIGAQRDDGGLQAFLASSSIEYNRACLAQRSDHVLGPGRADLLTAIGGGCSERGARLLQHRAHHLVRRLP